jgi:N-acetylmuramoyl-L-alanine amidase
VHGYSRPAAPAETGTVMSWSLAFGSAPFRVSSDLPLRPGATGDAVRDVQHRLSGLGYEVASDEAGRYGAATTAAVQAFQEQRGLRVDGICGRQTWASLVEAGYGLGDRLLYLHQPMLRGDDVAALQRDLGALGFDAGRVDGIFGPRTATAVELFQRNAGITTDGICGPDTVRALVRVARAAPGTTVAHVREAEAMRGGRALLARRVVVGETGGLAALAEAVGRALSDAGAAVAVLHHPDESVQAVSANGFGADAFLGLALLARAGSATSYYAAAGFESPGGRRLAEMVMEELQPIALGDAQGPTGMRLPILRETRMPAVLCELGPPPAVVERTGELVACLARALNRWVTEPAEP